MNLPLALVLLILFSGSILFNEAVGKVNAVSNGDHPLAAAEVAVGTLYTLFGAWLVDGECLGVWTILWCFVASGSPMIAGDLMRWVGRQKMKIPRWRWLAVALFVVFVYMLVALNFDALLAIQHWAVKAGAVVVAVLALAKYVQEETRIITADFSRDVEQPSFWERVL